MRPANERLRSGGGGACKVGNPKGVGPLVREGAQAASDRDPGAQLRPSACGEGVMPNGGAASLEGAEGQESSGRGEGEQPTSR
jgi:hypothetical protein